MWTRRTRVDVAFIVRVRRPCAGRGVCAHANPCGPRVCAGHTRVQLVCRAGHLHPSLHAGRCRVSTWVRRQARACAWGAVRVRRTHGVERARARGCPVCRADACALAGWEGTRAFDGPRSDGPWKRASRVCGCVGVDVRQDRRGVRRSGGLGGGLGCPNGTRGLGLVGRCSSTPRSRERAVCGHADAVCAGRARCCALAGLEVCAPSDGLWETCLARVWVRWCGRVSGPPRGAAVLGFEGRGWLSERDSWLWAGRALVGERGGVGLASEFRG
ncbi:hypothetical protein FHU30_003154 [Actinomadura rupiterrae]|nr:hypothetical protein [Actinomadura rupiterrae]